MPDWLVTMLRKNGQVVSQGRRQNRNPHFCRRLTVVGVILVLAQLLEQSPSTKYAYLCHPCVQHVSKLKREGMLPEA